MSPQNFVSCINSGGKVVTKQLKDNKFVHICYGKDGKSYTGEIKTRKKKKAKAKAMVFDHKKKIKESRDLAIDLRRLKEYFDENYRN
jgi:hypothetical protein